MDWVRMPWMKRQCVASMRPRAGHRDNPLIIHVPGPEWLERYCRQVPQMAYDLAEAFWPGPLTMILSRTRLVPDRTTGGLNTVGVRCPDHPLRCDYCRRRHTCCRAQCQSFRRPSCTNALDVLEDMEGKIPGPL